MEDYKLLKPLYAKYKNTGFEVFAVSVDDDQLKWKQTIRQNAYPWINVIDRLGPNAKAMGDYGIYKYPSNYLIDTNGKIIEKDIDMEDLEAFLKKRTN